MIFQPVLSYYLFSDIGSNTYSLFIASFWVNFRVVIYNFLQSQYFEIFYWILLLCGYLIFTWWVGFPEGSTFDFAARVCFILHKFWHIFDTLSEFTTWYTVLGEVSENIDCIWVTVYLYWAASTCDTLVLWYTVVHFA